MQSRIHTTHGGAWGCRKKVKYEIFHPSKTFFYTTIREAMERQQKDERDMAQSGDGGGNSSNNNREKGPLL